MSVHRCDRCSQEMRDAAAVVCKSCVRSLRDALDQIADRWVNLEEAITRQTRMTAPTDGGHSENKPVPFDPAASAVADGARASLVSWVRITVEDMHAEWPDNTIGAYCRHLRAHTDRIRMQRWATEMIDGLVSDAGAIARVIDYDDERSRIHVGPCPVVDEDGACPGQIHAHIPREEDQTSRPVIRCHACNTEWHGEQWSRLGELVTRRQHQIMIQRSYGKKTS